MPSRQLVLRRSASRTVGALFESVVSDRRPADIATQPLEASAIPGGDADAGVKAHLGVARDGCGAAFEATVACRGLDLVAEASPALSSFGAAGDTRAERGFGEESEQGFVPR